MRKPKVVIIGPLADPTDVGEALSTFRWTQGIAEHADVTLLTYVKRGRSSAKSALPGVRVIEWNDLPIPARFERLNAALHPGYAVFYLKARRWLKRALAQGESFDLVHQVAPLALRYPSPAAGLPIPLVIGPLAGSLSTPDAFAAETSGDPWFVKLRRFDQCRFRHDPFLRRTYESAATLIGVAPYVRDILGDLKVRDFALENETGIPELPPAVERDFASRPFRLLYVGRIVRTKGVRDAVRAMTHLADLDVRFDVVGAGSDLDPCKAEAASLGLTDRVHFHGRKSRVEVDPFYRDAHAFFFPSFREPSGNVVLEAMSWGLPMIVADRGGPSYAVNEKVGVRVQVRTPTEFARGLADAVRALVSSPDLAARQSRAARATIETEHLWPAKIRRMLALYERVIGDRATSGTTVRLGAA